jgi:hypothetical protein
MLYTTTSSDDQVDRIRLFPSPEAAVEAVAHPVRAVHGVAVILDRGDHRLIPLWTDPQVFDSAWTAPAELLADRSIIARCPIPAPLFVHDLDVLAEAI